MNSSTRLCIAGKNQIAVDILDRALALPALEVSVLPVAGDDGADSWQPSLRRAAIRAGVPVVTLEWAMQQPDLTFLSLEYDRLIAPACFESNRLFNIHFSLLPQYRGCFTAIWPILHAEMNHGVTLHWIDAGMDTGAIIDRASFALDGLTARDAYFRCMDAGRDLVVDWLDQLLAGNPPSIPQDERSASTFRRKDLDFGLAQIDVDLTVEQALTRIRAFTFSEYQFATFRNRSILGVRRIEDSSMNAHDTINYYSASIVRLRLVDGVVELNLAALEGGLDPLSDALDCPPKFHLRERRA